jgi:hypothetical protein
VGNFEYCQMCCRTAVLNRQWTAATSRAVFDGLISPLGPANHIEDGPDQSHVGQVTGAVQQHRLLRL